MAIEIVAQAFKLPLEVLSSTPARFVLVALANYASENGQGAYPSIQTIQNITGLSRRSVQNSLALLLEMGLIREGNQAIVAAWGVRADRRPMVYDVTIPRGAPDAPREAPRGAPHTARGAGGAPNTLIEPKEKDSKESKKSSTGSKAANPVILTQLANMARDSNLEVDLEVLSDFVIHRQQTGNPLTTATHHKGVIRELLRAEAAGISATDALATTIEKGWRGVKAQWLINDRDGIGRLPVSVKPTHSDPDDLSWTQNTDGMDL